MISRRTITLTRQDQRLVLSSRRSGVQWLDGGLALIALAVLTVMCGGIVVAAAVHGKGLQTAFFLLLAAVVGGASLWEQLQDADCTSEFDLDSHTITASMSGWRARRIGPIPFDQVVGLDTTVGSIGRSRAAVATLRLADGSRWELGKESVFVRRISTSIVPSLLSEIRSATGLPGEDDPT